MPTMIGYLDCPSGISGDMFLSCLVDAGWHIDDLKRTLARLPLPGEEYEISSKPVMKGPLRATQVTVGIVASKQHRHLGDIRTIVQGSGLSQRVKDRAMAIFTRLAHSEAKVHGMSVESVHFHEVGAVDAIVDIVGAAAGFEALGLTRLYASPLPLAEGWAKTAHGLIPLPAPATLELLAAAKAPTRPAPGPGELVTPTGAAILAEMATFTQPQMTLHKIALGAGQKDFAWPNIARLWVGEDRHTGPLVQLETNIDDMNPQFYTPVTEKLFTLGALDVWLTPTQMKKGRPATTLSVLAPAQSETVLAETLLRETTTLGLRVHPVTRHEARREIRTVETEWGSVHVKLKYLGGAPISATPEYDDCLEVSRRHDVPLARVTEAAHRVAEDQWLKPQSS
jgi:uncharacterized protein (TIGR00299 family) protein